MYPSLIPHITGRAIMTQFIGHRNQIEFFVRFKADRSLKCSLYDPYVYDVVYLMVSRVSFELLSWFHC